MRERMLALARGDSRISGGAVTGSAAVGAEDRWSDVDLSFGVVDGVDPAAVLDDWTDRLDRELGVLHHWDLGRGSTIYRVLLLRSGLQVDVAVTPAAAFGARGPNFRAVFGESSEQPPAALPPADELIGLGWVSAVTARAAIARGRPWQAEHWISSLRDQSLALACLRLGESPLYGRGLDRLPSELLAPYEQTLVVSLEPGELVCALAAGIELFLAEVGEADPKLAERLQAPLRAQPGPVTPRTRSS